MSMYMTSSNVNVCYHSKSDTEEINPYEEMMMKKFERHDIDQTKTEMDG